MEIKLKIPTKINYIAYILLLAAANAIIICIGWNILAYSQFLRTIEIAASACNLLLSALLCTKIKHISYYHLICDVTVPITALCTVTAFRINPFIIAVELVVWAIVCAVCAISAAKKQEDQTDPPADIPSVLLNAKSELILLMYLFNAMIVFG